MGREAGVGAPGYNSAAGEAAPEAFALGGGRFRLLATGAPLRLATTAGAGLGMTTAGAGLRLAALVGALRGLGAVAMASLAWVALLLILRAALLLVAALGAVGFLVKGLR